MTLIYGPKLELLVGADEGEEHYVALEQALRGLDQLVQPTVLDQTLTAPPGSPADGDAYLVAAGATGAWAAKDLQIARWSSVATVWEFYSAQQGWQVEITGEAKQYRYTGSTWSSAFTYDVLSLGASPPAVVTGGVMTPLQVGGSDATGSAVFMYGIQIGRTGSGSAFTSGSLLYLGGGAVTDFPSTNAIIIGIEVGWRIPLTASSRVNVIEIGIGVVNNYSNTSQGVALVRIDSPLYPATMTVNTWVGFEIQNQGHSGIVLGTALLIDDQTGSTTNRAIATGLGTVTFGDVTTVVRNTANQFNIANVAATQIAKFNVTSAGALEITFTGTTPNFALFAAGSYGGGKLVMFIANATTVPTSAPAGGGVLCVTGGQPKFMSSGGVLSTMGY